MNVPSYPEHEKLDEVREESQTLGFFLEWLQNKYRFCKWHESESTSLESSDKDPLVIYNPEGYYPENIDINRLLAEYYDIDYDKLMTEKDQIWEDYRKRNP